MLRILSGLEMALFIQGYLKTDAFLIIHFRRIVKYAKNFPS